MLSDPLTVWVQYLGAARPYSCSLDQLKVASHWVAMVGKLWESEFSVAVSTSFLQMSNQRALWLHFQPANIWKINACAQVAKLYPLPCTLFCCRTFFNSNKNVILNTKTHTLMFKTIQIYHAWMLTFMLVRNLSSKLTAWTKVWVP